MHSYWSPASYRQIQLDITCHLPIGGRHIRLEIHGLFYGDPDIPDVFSWQSLQCQQELYIIIDNYNKKFRFRTMELFSRALINSRNVMDYKTIFIGIYIKLHQYQYSTDVIGNLTSNHYYLENVKPPPWSRQSSNRMIVTDIEVSISTVFTSVDTCAIAR